MQTSNFVQLVVPDVPNYHFLGQWASVFVAKDPCKWSDLLGKDDLSKYLEGPVTYLLGIL
jgi:hypothetical protein